MRLLLYSQNYAPESIGTSKYNDDTGSWFASQGVETEVVADLPHYPQWEFASDYTDRFPHVEKIDGVSVMCAPHFVPSASALNARARLCATRGVPHGL